MAEHSAPPRSVPAKSRLANPHRLAVGQMVVDGSSAGDDRHAVGMAGLFLGPRPGEGRNSEPTRPARYHRGLALTAGGS